MNLLQLGSTSLGGESCLFAVPFADLSYLHALGDGEIYIKHGGSSLAVLVRCVQRLLLGLCTVDM